MFRHSYLIAKTKRSANAFRLGLRAGNLIGLVPLSLSICLKQAVNSGSLSMRYRASCNRCRAGNRRKDRSDYGPSTLYRLHPDFAGLIRNADNLHLSRFKAYREQDVVANDSRKCQDFDVEEVDSGQNLPMCFQKGLPGRSGPLTLRRGFDALVTRGYALPYFGPR